MMLKFRDEHGRQPTEEEMEGMVDEVRYMIWVGLPGRAAVL